VEEQILKTNMRTKFKLLIAFCLFSKILLAQKGADSVLNFILKNKNRAAVYLVQNDTVLAKLNENKLMPLASTVKILVALEFAKQAAKNEINENSFIALADLDKYYLANTDGNAHPDWIEYEKSIGHIKNDSVVLLDVARGMIQFSSNANTEYLMDLLGLDEIQKNLEILKVENHTKLYPVVASLFMYQNPKKLKEDKILKGIKKLSEEQYCRYIYDIHKALKNSPTLKSKFNTADLTMTMQKVWSDKLTASTAKEYAKIMSALNNRAYFDEDTYAMLSLILETAMENPANKTWLKHLGMKGGSTAWILTKAVYATTKKNKKTELVYFFNNLTEAENDKLQNWLNDFELNTIAKDVFREKIKKSLQ
jgi:D-alanyl-D-alanine carboxypeptidase